MLKWIAVLAPLVALAPSAMADDANELAAKLQNPVASLISVPLQNNFDWGGGPEDEGFGYTLNIQPVIPVQISEDWNLIIRTILPVSYRGDILNRDVSGLGDTYQSFFFSPRDVKDGFVWAVGPILAYPTATEHELGTGKLSGGPTALLLKQGPEWTYGILASHLWSLAGPSGRSDVSLTLLQPFLSYNFGAGLTATLNSESSYDWESEEWVIPLNLSAAQVLKFGSQPVSLSAGVRYYADKPQGGPDWGLRLQLTLLFPT